MPKNNTQSAIERMQRADLTFDELREVVAGVGIHRASIFKRMTAAGLSLEEVKELLAERVKDSNSGSGSIGTSVGGLPNTPPAGGTSTQG
jgi:hypothetical protein